jgi:hypothetical protein
MKNNAAIRIDRHEVAARNSEPAKVGLVMNASPMIVNGAQGSERMVSVESDSETLRRPCCRRKKPRREREAGSSVCEYCFCN